MPAMRDIIASESSALRNDKDMDCTVVLLGSWPTVDYGIMPQSNILLATGAANLVDEGLPHLRIALQHRDRILFLLCWWVFWDFFSHSCSQVEF